MCVRVRVPLYARYVILFVVFVFLSSLCEFSQMNTFLIKVLFSTYALYAMESVLFFFHTTFWRKLRSLILYDCIWFLWQHRFYIMLKSPKRNRRQVDSVQNIGKKRTINQLILLIRIQSVAMRKQTTMNMCGLNLYFCVNSFQKVYLSFFGLSVSFWLSE